MLRGLPRNQKYFPYIMPPVPALTVRAGLPEVVYFLNLKRLYTNLKFF
jgi:hypothetical protein